MYRYGNNLEMSEDQKHELFFAILSSISHSLDYKEKILSSLAINVQYACSEINNMRGYADDCNQ